MSLPCEEKRALEQTRMFLVELLDPKQTPRVPAAIRKRACRLLKHYPLLIDWFVTRQRDTEGKDAK
jgi:hypothetical protein